MVCRQCHVEHSDGFMECYIPLPGGGVELYDFDELRRAVGALEKLGNAVGNLTDRPSGWHKGPIQFVKKLVARLLSLYTQPSREFNASVSRSLEEIVSALDHLSRNMVALDHLSRNMVALEGRLVQSETRNAARVESMQEEVDLLREQVRVLVSLQKTENLQLPSSRMEADWGQRAREISRSHNDIGPGNDRTSYLIGLFGTGRSYLTELMLRHIGERAKYVRDTIRLHPGPTPMIYSGHATMKHVSRAQYLPAVMSHVLEAVQLGFADLIFLYRHPIDSLLTNWIWWRTYIRDNTMIQGISQVYKSTGDLCADLEQNFLEFQAFAQGDPGFFASLQGPRFLSFPEFVEETDLHLQSATLTLRLEDFMDDPFKEFSKIVEVMLGDRNFSRVPMAPPKTKPYGYLAVLEKVPRFRNFITGLDAETKRRIERIGYSLT